MLVLAHLLILVQLLRGVNVAKNEGFKTVITIRGIGNEANQNAIANPSVSYHLDGIYIASPFSLQTDFLDLERVERYFVVHRGLYLVKTLQLVQSMLLRLLLDR